MAKDNSRAELGWNQLSYSIETVVKEIQLKKEIFTFKMTEKFAGLELQKFAPITYYK
jgi:hypothetical protein